MKTVKCSCEYCGKEFDKSKSEWKRSERLNRKHFCRRSCATSHGNKANPRGKENLPPPGHRLDKHSPFRYFIARAKARRDKKGKSNLTVEYLKNVWDTQKGLCATTGISMVQPRTIGTWNDGPSWKHGSMDRIDNNKGYVQGNIRFVCHMYNIARWRYNDDDVAQFCEAVVNKNRAS